MQFELSQRHAQPNPEKDDKISARFSVTDEQTIGYTYPGRLPSLFTYTDDLPKNDFAMRKAWLQTVLGGILLSFFSSMILVFFASMGYSVFIILGGIGTAGGMTVFAFANGFGLFAALVVAPKHVPFCWNPSLTLIEFFMEHSPRIHVNWGIAFVYTLLGIIFSFAGSFAGAALVNALEPAAAFGLPSPAPITPTFTVGDVFLGEWFGSFILTWVFLHVYYDPRPRRMQNGPLVLGTVMIALSFVLINYTGASLNWTRHFGPLILSGAYMPETDWVYYVGPFTGNLTAVLAWYFIFRTSHANTLKRAVEKMATQSTLETGIQGR